MDNRYELAEQYGMSKEFVDWFFDKKKDGCGNQWFIMMAAMWEGWKGALGEQPVVELPERYDIEEMSRNPYESYRCIEPDADGDYLKRDEVIEVLTAAGIRVKSD